MVKFISLTDMQAMPIEQQDAIGQRYLAGVKKTRNENSELKEDQKNVAKWMFCLSTRLNKARENNLEASNTSLDDYFKRYGKTDGKIPGHLYNLLQAAGIFIDCACGFTETEFDKLSSNCNQKLGAIKRLAGSYDHPAVINAVTVVKEAPHKEIASKLQDILDGLKPPMSDADMDKAIMVALRDYLSARRNGLAFVCAGLPDFFKSATTETRTASFTQLEKVWLPDAASVAHQLVGQILTAADDDAGKQLFTLTQIANESWGQNTNIPAERYDAWLRETELADTTAPTETPAETPATETPADAPVTDEVPAEEIAA